MKQRVGALLSILLGSILIGVGVTGTGATVGAIVTNCGGALPVGVAVPVCPTGHIRITKDVVGTGTAPASGWKFTINSSNCQLFPGSSNMVTIPAAGGTVVSDKLYSTTNLSNSTPGPACDYTVTETAVAGWTTTYSPTGAIELGTSSDANDRNLTVTNTANPTTTTPPPSTPVTSVSVSPSGLVNTGSKDVKPATIIGILLVLGGAVMLYVGRRRRQAH